MAGADEFERRRRLLTAATEGQVDPLAELARLVGQDDPFRGVSPQARSATPGRRHDYAAFDDDFRGALDIGEDAGAPDDPAVVHADLARPTHAGPLATPSRSQAPEISPDAWARGDAAAPTILPQPPTATRDTPMDTAGSSKRTLIVLAAVVALTGGGLAASFLAKPSAQSASVASVASTPTILAATGPSKVQPETTAADAAGSSEPSTLLDKNKSDGTATAHVVNSVEQPVDLNQAVKPVAGSDASAASSSPFPEPRKVKTILVRPDGTIISDRPAAADAASGNPAPNLAFDPKTSLPIIASQAPAPAAADPAVPAPPAAAPATPAASKSQARVPVTPKASGASQQASLTGQTHAPGATPKPANAAKPKPAEVADTTPPAATDSETGSLPSGKFAAQLGAGGSEAEARDLMTKLSRKFADAVSGKLSVHKAQSGDKTVYRVRAAGLSQEAAKGVCAKVTAGGGGCFVARD